MRLTLVLIGSLWLLWRAGQEPWGKPGGASGDDDKKLDSGDILRGELIGCAGELGVKRGQSHKCLPGLGLPIPKERTAGDEAGNRNFLGEDQGVILSDLTLQIIL